MLVGDTSATALQTKEFEIRALAVCQAEQALHNAEYLRVEGEETLCFFEA